MAVGNLAFTDALPAGVSIATPANTTSTCGGTLSAPNGGPAISLSGGGVAAAGSCTITVDVTGGTVGVHTNLTGDLTSDAGNSGTATDDLTVDAGLPGFTKSFAPSTVPFGGRSTLTFTIDNSANGSDLGTLQFTDALPPGMVVAAPSNAVTDCENPTLGSTLTAVPGASIVSLFANGLLSSFPTLAAGATCTVAVDVIGGAIGSLGNTTDELLETDASLNQISSGKAAAVLEVTGGTDLLTLAKEFTDDPVAPGGSVTLEFTVTNMSRDDAATNITFTDDLEAALSGLTPTLPSTPDPACGAGSSLSFDTGVLTLAGGNLPAESSCTFSVSLGVPGTAAAGTYTNTTGAVSGDVGGSPSTGNAAGDNLYVVSAPLLTKEFTDDPVSPGSSVTLEFTLTNTDESFSLSDIAFEDVFDVVLFDASSVPADGFCGGGSTAVFTPLVDPPPPSSVIPASLTVSGASLDPSESCTFAVMLDVAPDAPSGVYPNTTSSITGTLSGNAVEGPPASDDLSIVAPPDLQKSFSGPVAPGGTVTLEFTLDHSENAPSEATGIGFTDDLDAVLSGLTATGLPLEDICGSGTLTGLTPTTEEDTFLTFQGGRLASGTSCTFSVDLAVPLGATTGDYTNTTSDVLATVGVLGVVTGRPAVADLEVAELVLLTKEFTDDPVLPGQIVTLRFTLDNPGSSDIAAYAFTDDLTEMELTGLLVASVPGAVCTDLSVTGTGTGLISVDGGLLTGGSSCSFEVTIQVPSGAQTGDFPNTTSVVFDHPTAPSTVLADPGADDLLVAVPLALTKEFLDDPVEPGDQVKLRFTISNADPDNGATALAFTDDLDAALEALALSTVDVDACGGTLSGTTELGYASGTLAAASSCVIEVTLDVPAASLAGSYVNTTSDLTGTINSNALIAGPASDDLVLDTPFGDHDNDGDGIENGLDPDDDNDGQSGLDEIACGSDPLDALSLSSDVDGDGIPDCVDPDDDNDGVDDVVDNCPAIANPGQEDNDGDGEGDACDPDDFELQVLQIIVELGGLCAGSPDPSACQDKVEDIVANANSAAEKFAQNDNQGALGEIEGAVGDLDAAINDGLVDSVAGTEQLQAFTSTSRQVAGAAINDAIARGGDSGKIADAQASLAEGDTLRDDDKFEDAVAKYKDATSSAEGA